MKKLSLVILLFSLICSFISCGDSSSDHPSPNPDPNDPFYGDWVLNDEIFPTFYEFDGLGKVVITVFDISDICAYSFDAETITIKTKREDELFEDKYQYSFNGDTLTLKNEKETLSLTKQ